MHIMFAGGGTLGPVTPLLAVAEAVRNSYPDAVFSWVGTVSGPEESVVSRAGIPFHAIDSGKLRRYFDLANFSDGFRIARGFAQSVRLLRRLRPDAVVMAGGFVAVPVVWAAALLRIPIHIHQQDIWPGLANRLSAPFADSISVTFEKSLADFASRRPVWTGNPVRPELVGVPRSDAARALGLDEKLPTALVFGGGTGAQSLNDLLSGCLPKLLESAQVVHSTGPGKTGADVSNPRYRSYPMLRAEMKHAYALADVVVGRAGLGTLSEISALGKCAVIIPIPGTHQEDNAEVFAAAGAAVVLDERSLDAATFGDEILALLKDGPKRRRLAEKAGSMMKSGAADAIASLVTSLAAKRD